LHEFISVFHLPGSDIFARRSDVRNLAQAQLKSRPQFYLYSAIELRYLNKNTLHDRRSLRSLGIESENALVTLEGPGQMLSNLAKYIKTSFSY
jgi:hypothetical protein